jgi:N-acetylneuraminic acid mutarotase
MRIARLIAGAILVCLAACGGGGGGGGGGGDGGGPPPTYSVAAAVSGLSSTGLVLQLNGGDNLGISTNGTATFTASLASGAAYTVTVGTQPAGETCTVMNGAGTVASANVTAPAVNCTPNSTPQYTVTVNVSGFAAGPTMVLQLDGISQLAITGNGSASFSTLLGTGENYVVTVLTPPAAPPTQTCTIANGSGTIGTANITNVNVTCTTTYYVAGEVYDQWGSGLVLQLNGGDDLTIAPNNRAYGLSVGYFTTQLSTGTNYVVTIKTQPTAPTQTCTVSNGSGTIAAASVAVSVYCNLVYVVSAKDEWTKIDWIGSEIGSCAASAAQAPFGGPVSRGAGVSWTDAAGNLWIFGGNWLDQLTIAGALNDIWKYNPGAGAWTCVNGGGAVSFGNKGMASPSNLPPPGPGASWFDRAGGRVWFFGDRYNALWQYDLGTGDWTWISGSNTQGASGVYGAQGTPALANVPGARTGSASWTDHAGNLWLFGGVDSSPPSASDFLNDLWEYNPQTGLWVWVAGSVAGTQGAGPKGVYGAKGIGSISNIPGGRSNAVTWTDSAGNLWLFGGQGIDSKGTSGQLNNELNDLWKYTPSATFGALGTWTWVGGSDTVAAVGVYGTKGSASAANIPGARWAASAWIDLSGNFWLFGGLGCASVCGNTMDNPRAELSDFWKYSPATGTWTWMSGSNLPGLGGQVGTPGVPAPGNTPSGRYGSFSWIDPSGNLWLFGGTYNGIQPEYLNDLWVYTPQ